MSCILKVVLIGNSGTGKSWLIGSYYGKNLAEIRETIGVHFQTQDFDIDGKKIKVQWWDTAGMERFNSLTSVYYRGADAVILVYDVTKYSTFARIKDHWMEEVTFKSVISIK